MGFQILDSIVGGAALVVGATYILGGLIVNLNLSRYGVTEYQILRVKYLVVGLIYLVNFMGSSVLSVVVVLFVIASTQIGVESFTVVSLLGSAVPLWLGARPPRLNNKTVEKAIRSRAMWILIGTLSLLFPVRVFVRQIVFHNSDLYSTFLVTAAVIFGALALIGQVYFYARYVYIQVGFDPIGTGLPVFAQLSGDAENITHLRNIGIPTLQSDLTDKIMLLDETDNHYIVAIVGESGIQAIEISKQMIKVVRYFGYRK